MIERKIKEILKSKEGTNKALIVLGARQTGKTTLLKMLYGERDDVVWLNGDEPDIQNLLENISSTRLKAILAGKKVVVIDEAQRIKDIGIKLKLITDNIPEIQVIASGSSSFDLANFINEPLTGRKWEFSLYPMSFSEMAAHNGFIEENRLLPHRMIYGYYPEVVNSAGNEKEVLKQLSDSYLYKDIFTWENIKKPEKLMKLLQAIAFQVGSEVSANELSNMIGLDNQTVEKYIQLLEQTYIVFRLGSFSRNLRKELKRARKIYFYDNGIRNSIIANFAPVELRNDVGQLWENFLISERIKYLQNNMIFANRYFWRTVEQQEIDYIEEIDGILHAYEFKWNPNKKTYLTKTFSNSYPDHVFKLINRDNYETFIM
ncbi:MAG TPA: ATP-binding protein [bacterium]|nr:ATP-binding protein [bacterium]MDX9805699.1 ATP-binding protein [bacterium]HOG43708.1 ATP-binding protein [bacterium]HPV21402.1 ATP-binding protein [bacterium]HPY13524.1 ATP-binding protein [bacterium]